MDKRPLIIAHRGGAFLRHENTTKAFDNAVRLGADMIEFDVRRSKDGKLVIIHEDNIDGRKISRQNYDELLEASRKEGFEIPLLEEVLEKFKGRISFDIELKEEGYEEEVVDIVKKYLLRNSFVMKSLIDNSVKKIKEIDPKIKTGLLFGKVKPEHLIRTRISEIFPQKRIDDVMPDFVSPHYKIFLIWRYISYPQLYGKGVYVWPINDKRMMKKLKHKVEAIITDRPDLALKMLK